MDEDAEAPEVKRQVCGRAGPLCQDASGHAGQSATPSTVPGPCRVGMGGSTDPELGEE